MMSNIRLMNIALALNDLHDAIEEQFSNAPDGFIRNQLFHMREKCEETTTLVEVIKDALNQEEFSTYLDSQGKEHAEY